MIHRNGESGNDDIVFTGGIVRIDAERVPNRGADLFRIDFAEFSVRPWIAEIENELICRYFHMDRVGCRGSEPYFRPSPASQNSEAEEKNDRGCGPPKFHCVV